MSDATASKRTERDLWSLRQSGAKRPTTAVAVSEVTRRATALLDESLDGLADRAGGRADLGETDVLAFRVCDRTDVV